MADLLVNGVFTFLMELIKAHRVIGVVSGQRCSAGSVKRLDQADGMPICLEQECRDNLR